MKLFVLAAAALLLAARVTLAAPPIAWQKMPILPPQAARAGVAPGGEGSQWPRYNIAVSATDPNFLLLPIDVGGLYRSLDGGAHWNQAMNGWDARGANDFAIDPRNAAHVLGVAGNSMDWGENWGQSPHGIYLSNDKAASWKQVLAVPDGFLTHVAFDPSSYDAAKKICTVAYYASYSRGLFRTDDGGTSWRAVSRLPIENRTQTGALLAVAPTGGAVYVGGKAGFYRSTDGGQTFQNTLQGEVQGISVVASAPNQVWVSGAMGLVHSTDGGLTFSPLQAAGVDRDGGKPILNINVSPADPSRMLCWVAGDNWKWIRYISHDGGQSFAPIKVLEGTAKRDGGGNGVPGGLAALPFNVRNGWFGWHPTNPNIVWGIGGDWATKSTDGGQTFEWSNNGNNGIMVGQSFNFSPHAPGTVMLGFQDYNGAFTTDGGQTWNYRDVSGQGWGGHCYGGFAVDKTVMWAGDADGWGAPRRTRISRDGGQTWDFARDADGKICEWSGGDVSYCDPKNINTLFASNWRSTDKGVSWAKMPACDSVYISAPDGTLIGRKADAIVTSQDGGENWNTVAKIEGGFRDVAFDQVKNRYYVVSQDRLKMWENGTLTTLETPRDQYGNQRVEGVAVDPKIPQIVYGGGPRNVYASAATVFRSTDSGATWENLTTGDGPHEVAILRVNPQTRDLWINGQCYGMWRLAAPTQLGAAPVVTANAKLSPKLELAQALPDTTPKQLAVNNGDMSAGAGVPDGWGEHWGDVKATRDTTVFHSAPASLRADAGGKSGQAFQMFEVPGGQTYTISGWMKTAGQVKAQVAAQSFAPDWSKNDFNQIRFFQGTSDWTEFSKEVAVPAWAARFNVQLMVEGDGQAWLDDVKVVAKGAQLAAVKTATNAATATGTDAADVVLTNVAVRLGPGNFNYNYGADWKVGENITTGEADGVGFVQFDTTENGGAGTVLNGADLTPQNQTHLALRVRALEGNKAGRINVNLNRNDADGGGKTVTFDLSKLAPNVWTTLVEPLPEGKWDKVQQIQVQGTNWSAGAQPLKIQIAQIGTTSVDAEANKNALIAAVNTPTTGPPTPDKPDVAGWGFWPDYPQAWIAVHRGFLERTAQAREKKDIDVVFLGDSITQGWKDSDPARAIFGALTKPYNAVNYAIGGDSTRQTLYHLQQGVLDGIAPKLAVIMIGTNNLYSDGNSGSDEDIAAGIKKVVATVGQKSPTTKILLLGILPRQNEYFSGRARHINQLIAPLDNGKSVRFLDMSAAFQQKFGVVKPELYVADQLHLAAPGYEVWAAQMKPLFEAMLR